MVTDEGWLYAVHLDELSNKLGGEEKGQDRVTCSQMAVEVCLCVPYQAVWERSWGRSSPHDASHTTRPQTSETLQEKGS